MQCEHCSQPIEYATAHSLLIVLQKLAPQGYSFYQCESGQRVDYHTWQHWHCSLEHTHAFAARCINEHFSEEKLHPIPVGGGTTMLHEIVLRHEKILCAVCAQPLTSAAYRFCLTRATPYNEVIDTSQNQLSGWCCSLDHARQSALAILANA